MRYDKQQLEKDLLLYAVTDRSWLDGQTLAQQTEEALKGGVTFVQIREKDLCREEFSKEARELKALCQAYGVPFVVNDDVELAMEVDADGVHVGQTCLQEQWKKRFWHRNGAPTIWGWELCFTPVPKQMRQTSVFRRCGKSAGQWISR